MTVDFRAEFDKRKDEFLADLFDLLRINSERDDSQADAQHPFGPGPVRALDKFLEIAQRDGYPTKNVDNYAGHFEFGEGDEVLGIFGHLTWCQQEAVGTLTHMSRKSLTVSSCPWPLTTRDRPWLVTTA